MGLEHIRSGAHLYQASMVHYEDVVEKAGDGRPGKKGLVLHYVWKEFRWRRVLFQALMVVGRQAGGIRPGEGDGDGGGDGKVGREAGGGLVCSK